MADRHRMSSVRDESRRKPVPSGGDRPTPARYSVLRVGDADFAYGDHDRFVAALGQAWDAGLVPEPRPSATAAELRTMPKLRGIDVDLSDLTAADVARERRFS
jgi:hypothetical protein